MAFFTTTVTFTNGQQVTSAILNEITSGMRLGAESVDGTGITVDSGGVLQLGTVAASNLGAESVITEKIKDGNVTAPKLGTDAVETAKIKNLAVTGDKIAADTIPYGKTLPADRAVKADMEAQTGSHFVPPDVMKYHPGIAKARGTVNMSTGAITGGLNVGASATGTNTARIITFTAGMANTSYQVALSVVNNGTTANSPAVQKSENNFTIHAGNTVSVDFVVFGNLQA